MSNLTEIPVSYKFSVHLRDDRTGEFSTQREFFEHKFTIVSGWFRYKMMVTKFLYPNKVETRAAAVSYAREFYKKVSVDVKVIEGCTYPDQNRLYVGNKLVWMNGFWIEEGITPIKYKVCFV